MPNWPSASACRASFREYKDQRLPAIDVPRDFCTVSLRVGTHQWRKFVADLGFGNPADVLIERTVSPQDKHIAYSQRNAKQAESDCKTTLDPEVLYR